jgi:serine kinase of HPr protein (carbohydrate metabolism regulator)
MARRAIGSPTIHATAVLIGARALLIRGPAGSGKSQLALRLIQGAAVGTAPFVRLIGDDRVHVQAVHGRLLVFPAQALAGLIEVRGLGIRQFAFEQSAVVGGIVDLAAEVARLPEPSQGATTISGIILPRLAVAQGVDPLAAVLIFLQDFAAT